ncbi:hypothetical protein ABZ383_00095 [Streptomyces sp. NPDC005900]|uniref:DUF7059 domain-containing protein n=1 Tax=Streptomyces sp. NPDC005900 TaxID=3154569 RepID=UPI0033CD5D42
MGLVTLLRAHGASGPRAADITAVRAAPGAPLATVVDLLMLSRQVPVAEAETIVSHRSLTHLVDEGLAQLDGDRVSSPLLRLVEHHGRLVFLGAPCWLEPPQYGSTGGTAWDSAGCCWAAHGRCLDLFSSTGTQAAVMGPLRRTSCCWSRATPGLRPWSSSICC